MGSISSLSPGLANLFQTLSNVNSPLLSSPSAVSALENASPADVAELSMEATQLQSVDEMFGISNSSSQTFDPGVNNLLESLQTSLIGSAGSPVTTDSPASLLELIG